MSKYLNHREKQARKRGAQTYANLIKIQDRADKTFQETNFNPLMELVNLDKRIKNQRCKEKDLPWVQTRVVILRELCQYYVPKLRSMEVRLTDNEGESISKSINQEIEKRITTLINKKESTDSIGLTEDHVKKSYENHASYKDLGIV